MTDRLGADKRLPGAILPGFDGVVFHLLAVIEPLHRDGPVEGDRFVEANFEGAMQGGRDPEGVGVIVEGFVLRDGRCADSVTLVGDEVMAVDTMEGCAELMQTLDVGCGELAGVVRRETQHQLCAASDCICVDIQ